LFGDAKSFQRLEDDVCSLFSEAHSCFFEHLGLLHEIRKIAARPWLLRFFFGPYIRFVKQSFKLLDIVLKQFNLLQPKRLLRLHIIFHTLRVVLKELITILIIIEDHLFEHFH
jgi:hypothetical protein